MRRSAKEPCRSSCRIDAGTAGPHKQLDRPRDFDGRWATMGYPPHLKMTETSETPLDSLLPVARKVLERYPFQVSRIEHLETHSNVMFRVETDRGGQMVLRVGTPHANSRSNIEIEVAWLLALNEETDLDLVKPVASSSGEFIVDEIDPDLGQARTCVLFTWVPGEAMGDGAGPFAYRSLGRVCAALQQHGSGWAPPNGAQPRKWDRVFYYDQDFDPIVISDPSYSHLFGPERERVINKAGEMAQAVIEAEWSRVTPQIVHGDLHEWNVHIVGGRMYVFDFEDVMLATPAQDVSIALYSSRQSQAREASVDAFRRGYESVRPWPIENDRQLDSLHAARQIMLMNYAARALPEKEAAEYLDSVTDWLVGYVDRYR